MLRKRLFWGMIPAAIALAASFASPAPTAYAHERWFVEQGRHPGEHFTPDLTSLLLALGGVSFILVALGIHHATWFRGANASFDRLRRWLPAAIEWRMVSVLSGVMLIANSVTGTFLAPELVAPHPGIILAGRIAQALIGLVLITQISFLLSGLLIVVLSIPVITLYFGAGALLDYGFEYAALAVALGLVGLSATCPDRIGSRVRQWMKLESRSLAQLPLPVVRLGLGLTFITLALHNKLLSPDMALTFLDAHDLNFMRLLGLTGFTNPLFVFAAGVAEVTVGLLLVTGIATRFIAAGALGILSTTLLLFGPVELIGHLPIMGIAILLVYRGSGTYVFAPPVLGSASALPLPAPDVAG
ncbi:MAG: DoxX family membrane protein [Chloroflexi bacterium]|nr:DoxX family membrane protein [Chloroflexota bacterium]